jgi:hypothetical protein
MTVAVAKTGFNISESPNTITIYYVTPTTNVTFSSVTANGSSTQTTTELTLTFSTLITGLSAADITLSGITGVNNNKGTLTGSNPYTLSISGFTAGGTLTVAVAKTGFTISGSLKTVSINYIAPVTAATLASYLATLSTNTALSPHNITLKVSSIYEFSTIRTALNGASNKYVYLDLTGSSITTIPETAFYTGNQSYTSCDTLTGITIPNSVTSIGDYAFAWCSNLASITIPDSVTSIRGDAFSNCHNLSSIIISLGNNSYTAENGVLYNKNKTTLVAYPSISGSYTILNTVTSIGGYAFRECTSLTSVTIPSSVTSIGIQAFYFCTSLASVTIDNGVTSIGNSAFTDCFSLASITIPNSVTSIGNSAFLNCISLASVTFQGTIPSSSFSTYSEFPGNLRDKYYEIDSKNGTPGTYTRDTGWSIWTRQ